MTKIIFLKGLPASGKSTWAKQMVDSHPGQYKRINKDDLRDMLDNGKWSKGNEKFVLSTRDSMIVAAIGQGLNVIVDDTNLAPKHEDHIRGLAEFLNAEFEIKDFTNVDIETCLERDAKRPNSVGRKVIVQMYNQFLKPKPPVIDPDPELHWAIICDVDGTLALFGDKNPYSRDFENDKLNKVVAEILWHHFDAGYGIIIVSGREDKHRTVTETWLIEHGIPYEWVHMRPTGDHRKDFIVKQEIYDQYIRGRYNVAFVLDDRDQTVAMWRRNGLTCLQVADGNF